MLVMSPDTKKELIERIDTTLDSIRPHLKMDGGNVEVVDVTDDMKVQIKWMGNCQSCNMSAMTMRAGIMETLKSQVPEIMGVEALNGVDVEK